MPHELHATQEGNLDPLFFVRLRSKFGSLDDLLLKFGSLDELLLK